MNNKDNIQQALIEFLYQFPYVCSKKIVSIEDLQDGLVYLDILKNVDGFKIDQEKIIQDTEGNWALNEQNLKQIQSGMSQFWFQSEQLQLLKQQKYSSLEVDEEELIEQISSGDFVSILKLFDQFMSVLIESNLKDEVIDIINGLSEQNHLILKQIIQRIIQSEDYESFNSQRGAGSGLKQFQQVSQSQKEVTHFSNDGQVQSQTKLEYSSLSQNENNLILFFKRMDDLEVENQGLQEQKKEKEQELFLRQKEVKSLREDLLQKDRELSVLKNQKFMESSGNLGLNEGGENLLQQLAIKDQKIQDLQREIEKSFSEREKIMSEKQMELEIQQKQMNQLKKNLKNYEFYKEKYQELEETKIKLQEVQNELQIQFRVKEDHDRAMEIMNQKYDKLKERLQQEKQKVLDFSLQNSQKDTQVEQMDRLVKSKIEQIARQEEKIQELSIMVENLEQESSRSHLSQNQSSSLGGDFNQILEEKEKELARVKQELNEIKEKYNGLEQMEFEQIKEENEMIQKKVNEIQEKNIQFLQRIQELEMLDGENLKKEIEELKKENQKLQDDKIKILKNGQKKNDEQNNAIKMLNLQVHETNKKWEENQIQHNILKEKYQEMEKNLKENKRNLLENNEKMNEVLQLNQNLKNQVKQLQQMNVEKQENQNQNESLQELFNLNEQLSEQIDEKNKKINELTQQIRIIEMENFEIKEKIKFFEEQVQEKNSIIENQYQVIQEKNISLQNAQTEIQQIQYQIEIKNKEFNQKNQNSVEWENKIKILQQQNNDEIRILTTVLYDLRAKYQQLQQKQKLEKSLQ